MLRLPHPGSNAAECMSQWSLMRVLACQQQLAASAADARAAAHAHAAATCACSSCAAAFHACNSVISAYHNIEAVMLAFLVTSVAVVCISLFAINTKIDVTRWGTLLLVALVAFIVLLIVGLFWINKVMLSCTQRMLARMNA